MDLAIGRSPRFGWITDTSIPQPAAEWDREVLRSDKFVVLPSVGALVPGWTLVVPRRPMHSLSETTRVERVDLFGVVELVGAELANLGLQIYCFEHGARKSGSLTGCGVDQAHLHIVPLSFDLIDAVVRRMDSSIAWGEPVQRSSPLSHVPQDGDYVLVWRPTDRATLIGLVVTPVSQWVRRVIAAELGLDSEWDYRKHPHTDNVVQTLEMLADLRAPRTQ